MIWIAPRDELATREKLALEAQQQISDLEQTRTEVFQLNYHKADAFVKILTDPGQRILSKRGSAVIDPRSNKLFVQDTPSKLEEVRRIIAGVDVPQRQVMIEARIVEANDSFSKSLGARLGILESGPQGRTPLGSRLGVRANIGGEIQNTGQAMGIVEGDPVIIGPGLNANLPAAGFNSFNAGQFSFILFNSGLTRFLNLELSALEADGKGKIIASPRVLTADQIEAVIEQGTEIPYQQATSRGATAVAFRKANLALKVKPQITPDGNIIMALDVNKDQPGGHHARRHSDQHQAREDRSAGGERRHGGDRRHLRAERPHRHHQGAVLRRPAGRRLLLPQQHHDDEQDRTADLHHPAHRQRKAHGSLIAGRLLQRPGPPGRFCFYNAGDEGPSETSISWA